MKKLIITLGLLLSVSAFAEKKIVLTDRNTIVLDSAFDSESTGAVISQAVALDRKVGAWLKKEHIYLLLRTPGGEVTAGMNMISTLNGLHRPVDTITIFAASMGFQAVQGLGQRYILPSGVLMSHRARGGVEGEMGGVEPSQIESRLNFYLQSLMDLDLVTVKRTKGKQTLESYRKAYASELWVMGQHAVDQGYADEVASFTCDKSLDGIVTKQIEFMGIQVQYDQDKCPLTNNPKNIRVMVQTQYGLVEHTEFLARGGVFGTGCEMGGKLCSINPGLTLDKIGETIKKFRESKEQTGHVTWSK